MDGVPARPGRSARGRRALLGAMLLGILGMHALTLGCASASAATTAHPMAAHMSMPLGHAPGPRLDQAPGSHALQHGFLLCGALLLGAAGLVLARRALRGLRTSGNAVTAPRTLVRGSRRPHPIRAGPPLAWSFSVVRC